MEGGERQPALILTLRLDRGCDCSALGRLCSTCHLSTCSTPLGWHFSAWSWKWGWVVWLFGRKGALGWLFSVLCHQPAVCPLPGHQPSLVSNIHSVCLPGRLLSLRCLGPEEFAGVKGAWRTWGLEGRRSRTEESNRATQPAQEPNPTQGPLAP